MARTLRTLTQLMGWSSVAIGLYHVLLGNAAIPGAGSAGTTVDSWGRFMGASFVGYGLAWLWAARQRPIPAQAVLRCSWVGRAVVGSGDPETPGMAFRRLPTMVSLTWPPGVSRRRRPLIRSCGPPGGCIAE
ncbi:DUF4345 domain-containing protein [Streptomyces sp. NBC_01278]|uniref:DUF4345 domain-containing protein n=1 Tax=Streptomyces sp. NBC_01278 TaxID=2903809 RepID=UPI003FCC9696